MFQKNDGLSKKRAICGNLGWPPLEYEKRMWQLYQQDKSANDIAMIINAKLPRYMAITPRSIQRHVKKYAERIGRPETVRTNAEGFRLKVSKGEVNWACKVIRSRKNNIGKAKRFSVLNRDNFACVLCGATAKQDIIEVDHIIALVNGGSDEMDNLRTLCASCNIGKAIVEKER